MKFKELIKPKIKEISRDLESDKELQLDVEMELESHLLDSFDRAQDRGMNEEESAEHALKEFGNIAEIKNRIIPGNLKRMNKRAKLKTILWFVTVPAAIVLALFFGGKETLEMREMLTVLKTDSRLLEEIDKESPILKIRELERNSTFDPKLYDELVKIYPNNGYIDVLWMNFNYKNYIDTKTFEITDETGYKALLEKLVSISQKPEYNAFRKEEMERIKNFGYPGIIKLLVITSQSASFTIPELSILKNLSQIVVKRKSVEELVLLKNLISKITQKSDTLIEILVAGAVSKKVLEDEELSKKLQEHSPESYNFFLKTSTVIESWRKEANSSENMSKLITQNGGILSSILLPALSDHELITEENLENSKKMELTFFEKLIFLAISSSLFIVILTLSIYLLINKLTNKQPKIWLIFSMKEWILHISTTVLLPVVIYQFYKFLPFSSVYQEIRSGLLVYLLEIGILSIIVVGYSSLSLLKKYRKRLITLEIEDEASLKNGPIILFGVLMGLLLILSGILLSKSSLILKLTSLAGFSGNEQNKLNFEIIALLFVFILILAFITFKKMGIKSSTTACLANGFLLHFSVLTLIVTLYSSLYLKNLETYYYSQEKLLISDEAQPVFSKIESAICNKIKKEIFEDLKK